MPEPHKIALSALSEPNFPKFFKHWGKSSNKSVRRNLLDHAVLVAEKFNDVDTLCDLADAGASLNLEPFDGLFPKILEVLLAINTPGADRAAIAIATEHQDDKKKYGDSLWYILSCSLLNKNKTQKAKNISRRLEDDYEKNRIAIAMLNRISSEQEPAEWLHWLQKYFESEGKYASIDDALRKKAIALTLKYENFSAAKPYIVTGNPSFNLRVFIWDIYAALLTDKQTAKIDILLENLPSALQPIKAVNDAIADEARFTTFEHEDFHLLAAKEEILTAALEALLDRKKTSAASSTVETIFECVAAAPSNRNRILGIAAKICCNTRRADIAAMILRKLEPTDNQLFKDIAETLVEQKLDGETYAFILRALDPWPSDISILNKIRNNPDAYTLQCSYQLHDVLAILKSVPQPMVEEESRRRVAQKEARAAKAKIKLNNLGNGVIHEKNPQYHELCQEIERYLDQNNPEEAFRFVQKIVPSGYRDSYLRKIALAFAEQGSSTRAQEASKQMQQKSEILQSLLSKVAAPRYPKTLTELLAMEGGFYRREAITIHVHEIFKSQPRHMALKFVFESEFLSSDIINLEEYGSAPNTSNYLHEHIFAAPSKQDDDSDVLSVISDATPVHQTLPDLIVSNFLAQWGATGAKAVAKLAKLPERQRKGLEVPVLRWLLARNDWDSAVAIINQFSKPPTTDRYGLHYTNHAPPLHQVLLKHFDAKTAVTKVGLTEIEKITHQELRAQLLYKIVEKQNQSFYKNDAQVMGFADATLRLQSSSHQFDLISELFKKFLSRATQARFSAVMFFLFTKVEYTQDAQERILVKFFVPNMLKGKIVIDRELLEILKQKFPFWHNVYRYIVIMREATPPPLEDFLGFLIENTDAWGQRPGDHQYTAVTEVFLTLREKLLLHPRAIKEFLQKMRGAYISHSADKTGLSYFFENEYFSVISDIAAKFSKDPAVLRILLQHLKEHNNQDSMRKIVRTISAALDSAIAMRDTDLISESAHYIVSRDIYGTYSQHIIGAVAALCRQDKPNEAWAIVACALESGKSWHNTHCLEPMLTPILNLWALEIAPENITKVIQAVKNKIVNETRSSTFTYDQLEVKAIVKSVEAAIDQRKSARAEHIYQTYLKEVQLSYLEPLLEKLIDADHLTIATNIIDHHAAEPRIILGYRKRIVERHFKRLESLVGQADYATKIRECYYGLILFAQNKSATTQNNIIKALKSLVNKAFLHYYETSFGQKPSYVRGKLCNFPVPTVNTFAGKTAKDKLQDFFNTFKMHNMNTNLAQYLEQIQPETNPDYLWLHQLHNIRNEDEHDKNYVGANPKVNGKTVDMITFLPKAIAGIEKIIIKLNNNDFSMKKLDQLSLDQILPFTPDKIHIAEHALAQDPTLSAPSKRSARYS